MHIFAAVNHVNWEIPALVEPWNELGTVTHFANPTGIDQWDEAWLAKGKPQFNARLLEAVQQVHLEQRLDLFFGYLSARWVYPETLARLREWKIPTVNISFDDSHAFCGVRDAEGWCGVAPLARFFDLCVTSQNASDVWKYKLRRSRVLFLAPGAPADLLSTKRAAKPQNAVCFVGQKYGVRADFIEKLRRKYPVETHGKGWERGELSRGALQTLYAQTSIHLGFGFVANSRRQVGLKGRDFEVTAAGGLYLTSFHPQLAECFEEGKEIEFYRNFGELETKVGFYLRHPEKAARIGLAAQERVGREHLWRHRFERILREVKGAR